MENTMEQHLPWLNKILVYFEEFDEVITMLPDDKLAEVLL